MNRFLLSLIALLMARAVISVSPQPSGHFFVQFRITTQLDSESAEAIDHKMKSKSGIVESRTDYITGTYFCILSEEAGYAEEDFVNWFGKMGYSISCYNHGVQNVDMMISPHVLKNCVDEEAR